MIRLRRWGRRQTIRLIDRVVYLLRRWRRWLDPPGDVERSARILVRAMEMLPGAPSGEYKRHQVMARLRKRHPEWRTRDLAFLLERVIQERR